MTVLSSLEISEVIKNSDKEVIECGVLLDGLKVFSFVVAENDFLKNFSLLNNFGLLNSSIDVERKVGTLNQIGNINR